MTENKLIAFRDPNGWRPLCLGLLNDSFVIASETCAVDLIDAKYVRDIHPGEIVIIDANGLKSVKPFAQRRSSISPGRGAIEKGKYKVGEGITGRVIQTGQPFVIPQIGKEGLENFKIFLPRFDRPGKNDFRGKFKILTVRYCSLPKLG